ncbi:hypothetical protein [Mariniflexile sp. HMF6888]|uniref:hypothetical protein n=1 Tax=Mariniflexile sp. HMF6888 TaxID=3373086 RepID=UPI0037B31C64
MNILRLTIAIILFVFVSSCTINTDNSKMIVEITTYKVAENITHEELLLASETFNRDYCSRCKGLISRQLLKTDDGYMDIFLWESKEAVDYVQKTFMQDEDALKLAKMIDSSSLTMTNYEIIETSHFNN